MHKIFFVRLIRPPGRICQLMGVNHSVLLSHSLPGTTADAFTLLERLEGKLDEHPGQVLRACVELAKMWRTDRYLKNLEVIINYYY